MLPASVADAFAALIAGGDFELPLLPDVAGTVLLAASDESSDTRSISAAIQRDPALTGHVLRIANSPLYSSGTRVASLSQAVSRLGMKALREIALLVTCQTRLFKVGPFETLVRDLFRHSLATAIYAQEVARCLRWNVEEAFLYGLFHDVGKPLGLQLLVDLHDQLELPLDKAAVAAAADAEHCEIGFRLVDAWRLPARVAQAVRGHHQPLVEVPAALTAFANLLAHQALDGELDVDALTAHPAVMVLNLYPDQVQRLAARRDSVKSAVESVA